MTVIKNNTIIICYEFDTTVLIKCIIIFSTKVYIDEAYVLYYALI